MYNLKGVRKLFSNAFFDVGRNMFQKSLCTHAQA